MSEIIISAEGVSKKFCKSLKRSMLYGMEDIGKSMLGISPNSEDLRNDEFWAVDDVSFELKRGTCLGLIGPNGSGKSTLLKMLNGIISPDKGTIKIKGRVGALIEVGSGFHPMLSGRENIYINGAILGFSKKDIDSKFDDIVNFAELGDFLDMPVKHYSSGMYVRLGFAIAIQMEPDVMLIDEVLAVGDIGFRAKCYNEIARIFKNTAVILVSHSMPQVAKVCSDVLVMNHGKLVYKGKDVPAGIEHYNSQFETPKSMITGSGRAVIQKVELESKGRKDIQEINYLDDIVIHIYALVDPKIKFPHINISFLNREMQIVAQCNTFYHGTKIFNSGNPLHITATVPVVNLNPDIYMLSVGISDEDYLEILSAHHAVRELRVQGNFVGVAAMQFPEGWVVKEESESYKEKPIATKQ